MTVRENVPYLRVVNVATPAAGAEFTVTAPGQGLWRIISLAFLFATDATVANRRVSLRATDGSSEYFRTGAASTQVANESLAHSAFEGSGNWESPDFHQLYNWPTRGLWLDAGHVLSSITQGIAVGDQFSAVALYVEEFPTGGKTFWLPTVSRAEY